MDLIAGSFGNVVLGGALIGLAIAVLLILTGRVASASGMLGSLLGGREGLAAASIAFIAGLFIAPAILSAFGSAAPRPVEAGWVLLAVGGVLVGLGARLGESGLVGAISGLARRSGRALTTFLAIVAGAAISLFLRQVLGAGGSA